MATEIERLSPATQRRRARGRGGHAVRLIAASLCLWLFAGMPASAELSGEDTRELEELLVRLGFEPGPVDGVADAQTAAAIEDYQSFAALRVDGVASPALLEELRGVAKSLGVDTKSAPSEAAPPSAVTARDDESAPTSQPSESAAPATTVQDAGQVSGAPWDTAVHLASFKQEAKAHTEWQRLQQRLPNLLGDMDSRINAFDLGDEGLFFRLYAGPLPNLATAQDFCVTLSFEGFRCAVARGDTMKIAATSPVVLETSDRTEEQEALTETGALTEVEAETEMATEEQPSEPPAEAGEAIAAVESEAVKSETADASPTPEESPEVEPPDTAESAATDEAVSLDQVPEVDITPVPPAQALAEPSEDAEPSAVTAAPTAPVTAVHIGAATSDMGPEAASEDVSEDVTAEVTGDSTVEVAEKAGSETGVGNPTLLFAATQFAEAAPEPISEDAAETGSSETAIGAPTLLVTAFDLGDEAQGASSEPASEPTGSVQEQTASVEPAIAAAADPNGPAGGSVADAGEPAADEPREPEPAEVETPDAEGVAAETAGTVPPNETEPAATQTAATQTAALGANGAEDYVKATAAFEVGDCAAALRYYAQAFEKGGLPRRALAAGHNNRGRCFYDRGGFEDALADFDRAIGLDREFAAAYYNRGRVHNAMGRSAEAKADLKAAYELGFGRLQVEE